MPLKTLTFEGSSSDTLFDMTKELDPTSLVLVNAKVITLKATEIDSIYLQIGTLVNSDNCIDGDEDNFYFSHSLQNVQSGTENISQYNPNIGFTTSGHMNRQVRFVLRYDTINRTNIASRGQPISAADLKYFYFQFQVLE